MSNPNSIPMSESARKFFRRDEMMGKDVYDSDAKKVGSITDLAFSADTKPALVITKQDKSEEIVPLDSVDRLGDIVLLKVNRVVTATQTSQTQPNIPDASPPTNNRICIKCGAVNPLTARFCTKCRNQFF